MIRKLISRSVGVVILILESCSVLAAKKMATLMNHTVAYLPILPSYTTSELEAHIM